MSDGRDLDADLLSLAPEVPRPDAVGDNRLRQLEEESDRLKPIDNAFAEGFNSRVRQECLNALCFLSRDDARCKIEAWRVE